MIAHYSLRFTVAPAFAPYAVERRRCWSRCAPANGGTLYRAVRLELYQSPLGSRETDYIGEEGMEIEVERLVVCQQLLGATQ